METSVDLTTLRDLTRGNPDFCEDNFFALSIATKSLDKTAESIYGLCLADSKGNKLYSAYVGQDVPDSSLGYDRLPRHEVREDMTVSDILSEVIGMLPTGAKLFSSHADSWARVIFSDALGKYPALQWDDTIRHIDIRALARNIETGYIPDAGMTLESYCAIKLSFRLSLSEVASKFGVREKVTIPAPEAKVIMTSELINILMGKTIKIPR